MNSKGHRIGLLQAVITCSIIAAVPLASLAAQSDATPIAECQSIQDDASRLACYDNIASPNPPAAEDIVMPTVEEAAAVPAPAETLISADDQPAAVAAPPSEKEMIPAARAQAPVPAPPPARAVPPAADAQPSAASTQAAEPAVLSDEIGRETVRGRESDEDNLAVRGRLVDCAKGRSGKHVFYFDNGQVWRQKDSKRLSWKECSFNVTISKDFFGYKMVRDNDKRTVRIERIE